MESGSGIWQDIVKKKYIKSNGIAQLKSNMRNSSVWNDLLKVKHIYMKGRSMEIGNGLYTSFWLDRWCGQISLKDKFPELYDISNEQDFSVHTMKNKNWRLTFRRWLNEDLQNQLRRMQDTLFRCCTRDTQAKWDWEKSGLSSVKSVYNHLCEN